MYTFLFYLLRVSISLSMFYFTYRLIISRTTFYSLNRIILLTFFVVTLILPLFSIQLPEISWFKQQEPEIINSSAYKNATVADKLPDTEHVKMIFWLSIIRVIYLFGTGICLLRYITGYFNMLKIILKSRKKTLSSGSSLYISTQDIAPFSWMKWILIAEKDYTDENSDIIRHEQAHVALRHSIDLTLSDIYCIVFWFNPFAWLLRNELRNVHEYQADATVLENYNDFSEYQMLLIRHCVGEHKFSLANNFESNNLQKRIQMIMKTKTPNKMKWLYISLIFSCVIAVSLLSIKPLQAREPEKFIKKQIIQKDSLSGNENNVKIEEKRYIDFSDSLNGKAKGIVIMKKTKENKDDNTTIQSEKSVLEKPLMLVDGKEVKSINNIDPNKIDNISVLKDKSATDLYGEKGKNGVVIITTKKNNNTSLKSTVTDSVKIENQSEFKNQRKDILVVGRVISENPPLYILDGKEISKIQMDKINPADIESVSVLKNSSATGIYGEKGKNGVIIITLKSRK
ncbi:MAG: M56 family metallopeptidase [Paludibacteraceae bacterium]